MTHKTCTKALLGAFITVLNTVLKEGDKLPEKVDTFFSELDKMIPPSKITKYYYCDDCGESQQEENNHLIALNSLGTVWS